MDMDEQEGSKQGAQTNLTFTMGAIPKENTYITSKFFELQAARENIENKTLPEIEEDCV